MEWRNFMAVGGCLRVRAMRKGRRGFAQIHRLRDVEVEGRAGRNAHVERVFVELIQETLGVDLPSGLESGGKGAFDPSAVDLRCAAKRRKKGGHLRKCTRSG